MEHESHIVVDGTSNLRDVGWLLRSPGTRRVFRSANLDKLSPEGSRRFGELGVGVVIDLRGTQEAAAAPDLAGATRVHLPIEPTVAAELRQHLAAGTLSPASAIAVMEATYARYVVDHAEVFAAVLHRVLQAGRGPVLIHCAAGKDRTGLACALILSAMGVASEQIMQDYLLSNQLYRPMALTASEFPDDVRAAVVKVRSSFLDAAFAAMVAGWGSADGYLQQALGIGPAERRAMRTALGLT